MLCTKTQWCLTILVFLTLIFPVYAADPMPGRAIDAAGATGSGETIYWILLTVVLTVFLSRSLISSMLHNPIFLIGFIIIVVISFLLFKAIQMAYGIDSAIDTTIAQTASLLR